jgi:hypothetical protein
VKRISSASLLIILCLWPLMEIFQFVIYTMQIPVAARSKAWVHSRSLVGIVGSNPAEGMDVCLL